MKIRHTNHLLFLLSLASVAFAADPLQYQFSTVDISVPGAVTVWTLEDINNNNTILTNAKIGNLSKAVIAKTRSNPPRAVKVEVFGCNNVGSTMATSINNQGLIVGSCSDIKQTIEKGSGFVRAPNGKHILLNIPGADHTLATGLNDLNQVVGYYYTPYIQGKSGLSRIHGFLWRNNRFYKIDFPLPNTYTRLWSINRQGKILGDYVTFDPITNETLVHRWFIYEQGNFILDFPENLEYMGGPTITLTDINNAGQIVVQRWNYGPEIDGVSIYKNGVFTPVRAFPPEWLFTTVRGVNDEGGFVGTYALFKGFDPEFGFPLYEFHGFAARAPVRWPTIKPIPEISILTRF